MKYKTLSDLQKNNLFHDKEGAEMVHKPSKPICVVQKEPRSHFPHSFKWK